MTKKTLHLTETKTGSFGYRRRVPDNLRSDIGKTEIVRSLRTRDLRVVPVRYAQIHSEVEKLFERTRRKAGISDDLAFDLALRSLTGKGLVDQFGNESNPDIDNASEAQDIVLKDAGFLSVDELSEELDSYSLGREPAKLRATAIALSILQGDKRRPTISFCLSQYLADKGRNRDPTKKDWVSYERERKRITAEFIKLAGDKDINQISRLDARRFVEILEAGKYSPESVKKQTGFLGALTGWALRELELEGTNPFSKLAIARPLDHSDSRISFEYDEVKVLLSSTESINEDLQDIVRLLACTGARLAEISGLEAGDISDDGKLIKVRFNDIRRLKNKMSARDIPVVDQKSAECLRSRTENRLPTAPVFPRYGRDGGADSASAALSKWLERIGLRDPRAVKPKTTHCLRHTFKDALRDTMAPDDIAKMIQGHTSGDAASKYGSNELIDRKREVMNLVWRLIAPLET